MSKVWGYFKISISMVVRIFFTGFVSVMIAIYTSDILMSPSFGSNNIVLLMLYFSFLPTFAILFVEFYILFRRRSKVKSQARKERRIYEL